MNIHSSAAVCWICLDEGPDETGKHIVRDCACRGNDAGFAHTSCIIKYATQKCKQSVDSKGFVAPWETCPNCNQDYQNDLSINLSAAFVSYAIDNYIYPENDLVDKMKVMEALRQQIYTNKRYALSRRDNMSATMRTIENLIRKLLAMVDQAKVEHDLDKWVHLAPTSSQFQFCSHIYSHYEAFGFICLGWLSANNNLDDDGSNMEITYYEKARDIYNSVRSTSQAKAMTDSIDFIRATSGGDQAAQMKTAEKVFFSTVELCGEGSEESIQRGLSYALSLRRANHSVEAERLVTKLSVTSHQVYGKDHICTKNTLRELNKIKRRFIHILAVSPLESTRFASEALRYEALQYENDEKKIIVVNGPIIDITQDNDNEERKVFSVPSKVLLPGIGCPVMCYGLINAPHLNGKLGDVRSISGRSGGLRLGVHFEDKSLKPAAVKPGNLHIAFDLRSVLDKMNLLTFCESTNQSLNDVNILTRSCVFPLSDRNGFNIMSYTENDLVDKMKVMEALKHQINANRQCALVRGEMVATRYTIEELIHKLLAMVDQTKVEHNMDGWEHMATTSFEFQHCCHIHANYEAFGYLLLGEICSFDESGASADIKISYYEKARDIYDSVGDTSQAKSVTDYIDHAMAKSEGDKEGQLKAAKEIFFSRLKDFGENAEETIQTGLSYALRLRTSNYLIQAERLAIKLSATSHQVYGKDHICTNRSLRILNDLKRRFIHMVALSPESLSKGFEPLQYEALRYENDGKSCIITGPIKNPKKDNEEEERKTISIARSTLFFPGFGCPVICRGLINAFYLNGKLGDVRSLSVASGTIRLGVHFEDERLKPAAVKPENLRIAFDLTSV